ncbi:MAG: permease [Bacteroidales bacterium]
MVQRFADWLVYSVLGLDSATHIGAAVNFFFYDTIKILILLFLISAIMGIINAYFPVDRVRNYLAKHKMFGLQYFLAAVLGAVTPFCSCSSVPLFIGFVKGGIPLGVTMSFLISSPLISEIAVAMFLGTFGVKVTMIYIVSGLILSIIGGMVLERFHLERYLTPWVLEIQKNSISENTKWEAERIPFLKRLPTIIKESWGIVRGVLVYVLIGIGLGAAMHGFVPDGFFQTILSSDKWYSVPLAVIIAVPVYANAAGIVPVIEVFVQKGIALGTAIAFMMAVIGLSFPEAMLLKKVMTWKFIGIFFGVVTLFIILSGWLFNWILR